MYFVYGVELPKGVFPVGVHVVADEFCIHFGEMLSVYEEPLLDGLFQCNGVCEGFFSSEALVCGRIVEVDEAVMYVLVVGDCTWAEAFIGVWEEEVVVVGKGV